MEIKHEKPDTTKTLRTLQVGPRPTDDEVKTTAALLTPKYQTAYIWREGQGAWKVSFEGAV